MADLTTTPSMDAFESSFNYVAVTPHDSTDLSGLTVGLYVGTAGNLVAVKNDDTTVTFTNVAAGSVIPIAVRRVNSTSTTASDIVALYRSDF